MILIDANILIYAYDATARQHGPAKRWIESVFAGPRPVRLPWATVLAFLRIMTNPRVFRRPLSLDEATTIVDDWLAQPNVWLLDPTERHWTILRAQLLSGQASGPLVTDAHHATLAIEHGATLYTSDRDFARFAGVTTVNPLEEAEAPPADVVPRSRSSSGRGSGRSRR